RAGDGLLHGLLHSHKPQIRWSLSKDSRSSFRARLPRRTPVRILCRRFEPASGKVRGDFAQSERGRDDARGAGIQTDSLSDARRAYRRTEDCECQRRRYPPRRKEHSQHHSTTALSSGLCDSWTLITLRSATGRWFSRKFPFVGEFL